MFSDRSADYSILGSYLEVLDHIISSDESKIHGSCVSAEQVRYRIFMDFLYKANLLKGVNNNRCAVW